MKVPNITIYGSKFCPDSRRARHFLDQSGVPYEYKDIDESPEFSEFLKGLNGGRCVLPTIRVDNQNYFNPALSEIEQSVARSASDRD